MNKKDRKIVEMILKVYYIHLKNFTPFWNGYY